MLIDARPTPSLSTQRVLVALDSPDLRDRVVDSLTRDGHEVSGVGTSATLLRLLRASVLQLQYLHHDTVPDAIVTDMQLPRCGDVDALEEIQSIRPRRVRVVLVADFDDEAAQTYARRHRAMVVDADSSTLSRAVGDCLSPEWDHLLDELDYEHDGYSPIVPREQRRSRPSARWPALESNLRPGVARRICVGCGGESEVDAHELTAETWFCEECRTTDLGDAWLDLGDSA